MYLLGTRTGAFGLLLASFMGLSLISAEAVAQDELANPNLYDLSRQSTDIGWLPGEQYDPRTGHVSHVMTDLEFHGDGLPITITRQAIQGAEHGIGLTFPKLKITSRKVKNIQSACGAGITPVFTDANTQQSFIESDRVNSNLGHFPVSARYISKDNWIIRCAGNKYEVVSPSGISYLFSYSLGGKDEIQHVEKVSDVHGNTLTYYYKGYRRAELRGRDDDLHVGSIIGVSSIRSNDGRIVTLEYGNTKDRDGWKYMDSNTDYVKKVYTNGSPNARAVNYGLTAHGYTVNQGLGVIYTYSFQSRNFNQSKGQLNTNLLSSVTYPTGGKVSYDFPKHATRILHDRSRNRGYHFQLSSRVTSGTDIEYGETAFEVHNGSGNSYHRVIKTPTSTLEYQYRKTSLDRDRLADEGKLIKTKVFPSRLGAWDAFAPGLVEKEYEYQVVNDFIPNVSSQPYRVAELVEERTRLHDVYPASQNSVRTGNPLDFRIEYIYDNDGSNPEFRLRAQHEYSAANGVRTTNYRYETKATGRNWFPGLLKSEILLANGRPTNDKSEYSYNYQGLLSSETHNGIKTSYIYDGSNVSARILGGYRYNYGSYFRGIPRTETDESGRELRREVNSDGTVRSETGWNQQSKHTYTYDKIHRLVRINYPYDIQGPTNYTYRSQNETYMTNPGGNGASTTTHYDGFGRTIRVVNNSQIAGTKPSKRITATKYDSQGRIKKTIYPTHLDYSYQQLLNFPGATFEYDGLGRKIKTTEDINNNGATRTRKWLYTTAGKREKIKYTDSRNSSQDLQFLSYGTPKQEFLVIDVDGNGVRTDYTRDVAGRVTIMKRDGKVRRYTYNWKKQLKSEYHPETDETQYTYHGDGQLKSQTNNGRITTYSYYPDNQLSKTTWDDGSSIVTSQNYYDNHGRLESSERVSSDSNLSVFSSYGYDEMGRITHEKNTDNVGISLQMSYQYDNRGNLSRMTYPNGKTYELMPNAYGEVSSIEGTDGKTIASSVWYHPNGAYYRIDSGNNSLRSGKTTLLQKSNSQHYKGSNRDTFYTYAYNSEDSLSNIRNQVTGEYQRMFYDKGNRLTKVDGTRLGTRTFEYNSKDDIKSKKIGRDNFTYNYDWRGRLTDITSKYPKREFKYNNNGEVTRLHTYRNDTPSSLRQLTMTRDSEGRLIRTSEGTRYGYDHRGLRFFKEKSGRIYSYYDLGGKLRYRLDQGAQVATEYHYVGNELIAKREISNGGTNPEPPAPENKPIVNPPGNSNYWTIDHNNLTISWNHSAWHQVQTEDGKDLSPKCNGGSSCKVPGPGKYKFIRHGDGSAPQTLTVNSTSTPPEPEGGQYWQIDHNNLTISWNHSAWHQVQTEDGKDLSPKCNGGSSCKVPGPGKYKFIRHGDGSAPQTLTVNSTSKPSEPEGGQYWQIDHNNLRISWLHSDWHQVQTEDGKDLSPKCNGGSYCNVPSAGKYKFIRHGGNHKPVTVTIGNASSVSKVGDYTVNHSTRKISWSVSGWHQIQKENGSNLNPRCEGGNSCTVPANGTYKVINYDKPEKDRVKWVKVGQ